MPKPNHPPDEYPLNENEQGDYIARYIVRILPSDKTNFYVQAIHDIIPKYKGVEAVFLSLIVTAIGKGKLETILEKLNFPEGENPDRYKLLAECEGIVRPINAIKDQPINKRKRPRIKGKNYLPGVR